jgi:Na+/melibiose symporter-like transporter
MQPCLFIGTEVELVERKIDAAPDSLTRLLRRRLVGAAAVTSLGDGLVLAAFPLLALRVTHNPLLISGMVVAARLPWLIVALPAGAFVDRSDRRRLVGIVDSSRAVLVAAVAVAALVGTVPIEFLYLAAFLVGVGDTLVSACMRATIPEIATGDDLVETNGRIGAAQTAGTRFVGPGIGGLLFSLSTSLPFFGDAASYVGSAVMFRSAMPRVEHPRTEPGFTIWRDVRTGLRWLFSSPSLRVLMVVISSFAFCQAIVLAVLVLYATSVLHLGATGYGVLLAVAGAGDVLASLFARRIYAKLGTFGSIATAGVVAAGGYLLLAFTTDAVLAGLALVLEASATSLGNVATLSTRQRLIPRERFGLVNNAFRMPITGLIPLGSLAGGALVVAAGFRVTFFSAGVLQLAALGVMAVPLRLIGSEPPEPAAEPV